MMTAMAVSREELGALSTRCAELAGSALSRLVRSEIQVCMQKVEVLSLPELSLSMGDPARETLGLLCRVEGKFGGDCAFLLSQTNARHLSELLLRQICGDDMGEDPSDFLHRSALEETANIIIAAFLNGFAERLGVVAVPGVPRLTKDLSGALLEQVLCASAADADYVMVFRTSLLREEERFEAVLLFVPDPEVAGILEGSLYGG